MGGAHPRGARPRRPVGRRAGHRAGLRRGRLDRRPADGGRARGSHRQPPCHARGLRARVPGQRRHRAGPEPARAVRAGLLLRRLDGVARRDHERPRRRRRGPLRPLDPGQLPCRVLDRRAGRRRHRSGRRGRRRRRARAARARRGGVGGDRPDVVTALPRGRRRRAGLHRAGLRASRRGGCSRSVRWPSPACSSRARRPTGARSTCATSSAPPRRSPPSASRRSASR